MYIVISMPNRKSVPRGVSHFIRMLLGAQRRNEFFDLIKDVNPVHYDNSPMNPAHLDYGRRRCQAVNTNTELEALARAMLAQHVSIAPHNLAQRAQIEWHAAHDLLLELVRKGQARAVRFGRFAAGGAAPMT
jgi:hypothetical protein